MSFFRRIKRIAESHRQEPNIDGDTVSSLSSANITIETELGSTYTGKSAILLKNTREEQFEEVKREIKGFLGAGRSDSGVRLNTISDSHENSWIILEAEKIEDSLAAVMAAADTVRDRGLATQLVACVFEYAKSSKTPYNDDLLRHDKRKEDRLYDNNQYLVYNFQTDKFYPFITIEGSKMRDRELETKIKDSLKREIPFEDDESLWQPFWNLPF